MKSILIIDDDPGVLETYQMALEAEGYQVWTAGDGATGIELARKELPDLILSDIHMPGTDGCSVLQAIRSDATLGSRQVVLMTGNPMLVTPRSGMEMGADDFLLKPFTLQELLRCIQARLQREKIHWRVEDRVIAQLRSTLASTLPHEFFTPLAGVLGLVDTLKHDLTRLKPEEVQDLLGEIEKCGWRLERTLKNFLMALEEPQPGEEAPILEPGAVRDLVHNAVAAVGRQTGRQADIHAEVQPVALRGSPADFGVVVEELITNACNFSRHGTPIEVSLTVEGALTVKDHGRGMTATQIERLGAFRQFDREKYEQQGLGLGLSLVQRLASRYRAQFHLESEPGAGTVAMIAWPLASVAGAEAPAR